MVMPETRLLGTRALVPKGVMKKMMSFWLSHRLKKTMSQNIKEECLIDFF